MPWPDAIIVSDTLQPNGWALSVHVSKKKVCTRVCVCVSKRTAGEGREEETLIEIPSAMSGRALVSEWHTHAHIFTLALIKVGFAIWRPCARLASLCSSVCLHLCVCAHVLSRRALYSTRASSTDACNPMTCVWRCASDKDQFRTSTQTLDIIHLEENYSVMQRTPVF